MWVYEKKLQYPVRVSKCDPMMAKFLLEQYGGADGELAAALRYLNQRYTIPDKVIGLLNDIGTEEFAHRSCRSCLSPWKLRVQLKIKHLHTVRSSPMAFDGFFV